MRALTSTTLLTALLSLLTLTPTPTLAKSKPQPPGKNAILLSNVQALTLRSNRKTTSHRVSPIPQLKCIGNSKVCNLYTIDTMRCTNEGYDYDEEDIQWTCTAPLPSEFKLGSTDVICEGFRDADDPWVLKGSCGVEYRLLLTDVGEERFGYDYGYGYGYGRESSSSGFSGSGRPLGKVGAFLFNLVFWGIFVGVAVVIFWPVLARLFGWRNPFPREPRRGWGGWGGGGGGDDGFYPGGPPPPYSSSDCSSGSSSRRQGWRPGFWSGALGGAAAGYQMGRNSGYRSGSSFTRFNSGSGSGEGSSRRSSSSPQFSSTTTGTGFGSTRRR